jgi:peptidoglycan/xylan/chitin deacetylase (PgdA/CDA1 family)
MTAGKVPGVGPTLPPAIKAGLTRARSVAWRAGARRAGDEGGLRVLLYHRVADDDDPLSLHPRCFQEQMRHLAAEGYTVVDLVAAVAMLDAGEVPPRVLGLTFDDGFADVRDEALPVLAEHGFRATVFVTTGVTDGRLHFPWYAGRQPPVLGWGEVAALDREGTLRFEAHTVSHPNLLSIDDAAAQEEITDCRRELEQHLGRPVTAFAYPAGLFGERERRLVAEAGYTAAVTCEPGVNRPGSDRTALRRRQIDRGDRLLDFRAKIGGGHDTPLPMRGVYRRLRYGAGAGTPRRVSSRA